MSNSTKTSNSEKLNVFVYEKYNNSELTDNDLVQLIILCFDLLGLKTINTFAKLYNKTYRGVSEFSKKVIDINGNKFVIDNE
jgi:hypothetical protein